MLFSKRMEIDKQFMDWCDKNGVVYCIAGFLGWAQSKGWINEEKVLKDLEDKKGCYVLLI